MFEKIRRWILVLMVLSGLVIYQPRQAAAQSENGIILLYFTGTGLDSAVLLKWATAAEFYVLGFKVERADSKAGPYEEHSGLIPAVGGVSGAKYEALDDTDVVNGQTYWYILVTIHLDGSESRTDPISVTAVGELMYTYLPVVYKME